MKAFIAMPFERYDDVWNAIKLACSEAGVLPVRIDESKEEGPIINQIVTHIGEADCIIAEISERNANVYYEVGLAHCKGKPTVLLAWKEMLSKLPFDIKHNRVEPYDKNNPNSLVKPLLDHLTFLKGFLANKGHGVSPENFLVNLTFGKKNSQFLSEELKTRITRDFKLEYPRIVAMETVEEGLFISMEDAFKKTVIVKLDVNGFLIKAEKV